jgi:hypothetical protein
MSQPIRDAGVYLGCAIFQNHNDGTSVKMLRAVTVEGGFLRDNHHSRLASLTALTYLRAELRGGSSMSSR